MKAAVISSPGVVDVETVDDPAPGPGQVVVEVAACGICATDLHVLEDHFLTALPFIPGHEFAGEVVAVGAGVTGLRVGDRVAVDPSLPCRRCTACRLGPGAVCPRHRVIGVATPGGAAEYASVPAANCLRLPDDVPVREAALIEPLSCAVPGYDLLRARPGASVLVYGAGTMGLMMLQLAERTGAASVDVIDPNGPRLAAARRLRRTRAVMTADDIDRPDGWDVVIDATGNERVVEEALPRVATGGVYLRTGASDQATRAVVDAIHLRERDITVADSARGPDSYRRAADLFAAGALAPRSLISHRMPLSDYPMAIKTLLAGHGHKIVVIPGS
ncbi:alcohol dehydrogenase catalytic domain-containing protein [Streptomyces sp. PTM05]|uniref:2-deoxy-scyllo-inosamine dehydrogenase n=1 Tax=Streptantibioticus parmotrematis TaxID=2873249 RepID=A0ABS7R4H5_9ACTN|nr:alcohol dehydrogenase catalytic domain-containing protein [Streptantibioticus parmotrematis]MBY8888944.1 alcohol dehydrogenase catalytic domain-containing protein [Streptantibioticus parmotrematis]